MNVTDQFNSNNGSTSNSNIQTGNLHNQHANDYLLNHHSFNLLNQPLQPHVTQINMNNQNTNNINSLKIKPDQISNSNQIPHQHQQPLLPSSNPILQTNPHPHPQSTSSVSTAKNKKQKPIPIELTAYGTTPSGKPRLFVCQVCTRAFARLEHLRRHERSHTKEKPFACGVCQRKFSRRDLLLRHAQKLHAGCSEAITRLRRRSRKESINSLPTPVPIDNTNSEFSNMNADLPAGNNGNINTANHLNNVSNNNHDNHVNNGLSNLKRRVSFSAQSGLNYASFTPDLSHMSALHPTNSNAENQADNFDHVEFSTPQLVPNDAEYWLNSLGPIPGLDFMAYGNNEAHGNMQENMNETVHLDSNENRFGLNQGLSFNDEMNHDGLNLNYNHENLSQSENAPLTIHDALQGSNNRRQLENMKEENEEMNIDIGYSFYDIPVSNTTIFKDFSNEESSSFPDSNKIRSKTYRMSTTNLGTNNTTAKDKTESDDKDGDEVFTTNYQIMTNFNLPNGYSFYGDSISNSLSSNATISPLISSPDSIDVNSLNYVSNDEEHVDNERKASDFNGLTGDVNAGKGSEDNFNGGLPASAFVNDQNNQSKFPISYQTKSNHLDNHDNHNQHKHSAHHNARLSQIKTGNFTKNKLFTNNIRYLINKSLSKYPLSNLQTPQIPSNEKLESYLSKFSSMYLSHFPFIHISKLNEYEIMQMTKGESLDNESSRCCLPLLIASMGAMLANDTFEAENLYEASRRCIHIYLESRKVTSSGTGDSNAESKNPLWLIQSLTLSVMYGLFSDNEHNIYIIIRQLNALNQLVKSSIRTDSRDIFSIYEANPANDRASRGSLFSYGVNEELKFKEYINNQSQKRIVLMIYRLTNFLLMLYNNPITLSINDLTLIELPTKNEEMLWNFKSYQSYQEYKRQNTYLNSIDLLSNNDYKVTFKELLLELTKPENLNQPLPDMLQNVSKYGLITLVHGLYEIKKLQHITRIDIFTILDKLSNMVNMTNEHIASSGLSGIENKLQLIDYNLVSDYSKVSSLISLNAIKEHCWSRDYVQFNANYAIILKDVNGLSIFEYLKMIDCGIDIFQKILFVQDDKSIDLRTLTFVMNDAEIQDTFNSLIVEDDPNSPKISIHSQMLYHFFVVFSVFSIFMTKNSNLIGDGDNGDEVKQLNFKYLIVLKLLEKLEIFLKSKNYPTLDKEFSNLNLSSSFGAGKNLNKTFYILKIGESILDYTYEAKMKIFIFKKLSENLNQLRKYLIDSEFGILNGH